jgi:hypothetical protein
MPDLPQLHPEYADICEAADMHAAYYRRLVWEHNIHPDNATDMVKVFMELAFQERD